MADLIDTPEEGDVATAITTKICKGPCGLEKPLTEFGTYKYNGEVRHNGKCKVCTSEHNDAWRAAKKPDPITGQPTPVKKRRKPIDLEMVDWELTTKPCENCGQEKPLTKFSKRVLKSGKIALRGVCKQCKEITSKNSPCRASIDTLPPEVAEAKRAKWREDAKSMRDNETLEHHEERLEKLRASGKKIYRTKVSTETSEERSVRLAKKAKIQNKYLKRKQADWTEDDWAEAHEANAEYNRKRKQDPVAYAKVKESSRRSYQKNKGRIGYQLKIRMCGRVRSALTTFVGKGAVKAGSTTELLGCTIPELHSHIESKFTFGMTWGLFMQGKIQIDHIIAVADFDLSDPEQQKIAFGYNNLQPLWAPVNLSKGRKKNYVPPAHILAKVNDIISQAQTAIQQAA